MDTTERDRRYEEYCATYAEQLKLRRFINALETDNEHIRISAEKATAGRDKRRAKKLIKINDKDIKKYTKLLSYLPEVPAFK